MGVYLETVRKFPHINLPNPPPLCINKNHKIGFLESESEKLIFGLAGIVMAGISNIQTQRPITENWGMEGKINLLQFTLDGNRKTARNNISRNIDNLLVVIPSLIPKKEIELTQLENIPLTLLGLMSLGVLCVNYPDMIGEAAIRFSALSYIYKYDKVAELLLAMYPEAFDGFKTVNSLIDSMKNKIPISESKLKEIYLMCNLQNK